MIGVDEYNVRMSVPVTNVTGDIAEPEYIETFLFSSSRAQSRSRLLIDIVRPQPASKRRPASKASNRSASRTLRTSSANNWGRQ